MIRRAMSQLAILLRHLRTERTMIATVALVVCLTSVVMAAIPRLYTTMLDDELTYRMARAPDEARNLRVSLPFRFNPDAGDADMFRQKGDNYQSELPDSLRQIITGNEYVIDTGTVTALPVSEDAPDFMRSLQLRVMSNVEEHIQLTAGRMPVERGTMRLSEWLNTPGARGEPYRQRFEVTISEPAAAEMGLRIGELTRIVVNDTNDQAIVHVTGTFNVTEPDADYWNGDTLLTDPIIFGFATDFGQIINAGVLIAPEAYNDLFATIGADIDYAWNYYVDPNALATDNYHSIIGEARQVQLTKGPTDNLLQGGHELVVVRNDLPRLLNDFTLQTNVALTVIALSAIGLLVTGMTALALLAALIADRRQATIALIRGRGASSTQLFSAQVVEGLILCVPAALAGYALALLLVDSRPNRWSITGSVVTAVLTIALLVIASRVNINTALGTLLSRASLHRGRTSPRRLAAEGAVVLVAVAGIVLLRRRGLEPRVTAEGDVSFDPFLAAVPILLTLAVGLVALRLYPLVMRLAARIAGAGRGLVVFVGLRRVSGQSPVAHLPLLVMLLAIGISIFTTIVRYSISEAQNEGAWQTVGAPYRVETPDSILPDRLNLGAIEGVTDVAEAVQAAISNGTLLAVETGDLAEMNAGTRADPQFPDSLLDIPGGTALGTEHNPLPAILAGWDDDELSIGSEVEITVPAMPSPVDIVLRVDDIRPTFAGLPEGTQATIVNLRAVQMAAPDSQIRPNVAYLDGDLLTSEQIELVIADQTGSDDRVAGGVTAVVNVDVLSRSETYEEIRDAPLSQGVTRSFALSVGMAALYAVLAIVTALTLTARARSRDLSFLRTLGLSQPQALRLAVVEQIPAVIVASSLGTALGIAIVRLIEPGLDVSAFVGPDTSVPLRIDWLSITTITVALTLVTIGAIAVFTAINRRAQLSQTLRVGDGG